MNIGRVEVVPDESRVTGGLKLQTCPACGISFDHDVLRCPECGERTSNGRMRSAIILIAVVLALLAALWALTVSPIAPNF
jgi:predicted nucleic acid-binding Zn ribbon protein